MSESGLLLSIFNIGFSAVVDGPGQRLVIYCKGCNLRCPWCAAPESIDFEQQVLFYSERVTEPADVIAACPNGAVYLDGVVISRDVKVCKECFEHDCIKACHPAFELVGQVVSVEALIERAKRYRAFFGKSGGVTVGGGEPTCQFDPLHELLSGLKDLGIHTAIETNGTHAELPLLFDLVDLLYIDFKHPDPACYPGDNSENVLQNIRQRYLDGGRMIVRIPLVSGYNADPATLHSFGEVLASVGAIEVEVLPYHTRGFSKWRGCGLEPDLALSVPGKSEVDEAIGILRSYGLDVLTG
jgi:pyruvate formate lyase activating enzyme